MRSYVVLLFALVCLVQFSDGMNIMDLFKSMEYKEGCKDRFCTRCLPGWIKNFQMGTPCVKSCPDGFYKSYYPANEEFVCRRCRSNCKECNDWLNCDVCGQGYSLLATAFKKCVAKCPPNYVIADTAQGQVCEQDLSGCVDESCSSCQQGLFLLQDWRTSRCVGYCPKGYFDTQEGGVLKCEKCLYNCAQCSDYLTCDQCMAGYSLVSDGERSYCLKQ